MEFHATSRSPSRRDELEGLRDVAFFLQFKRPLLVSAKTGKSIFVGLALEITRWIYTNPIDFIIELYKHEPDTGVVTVST